MGMLMYRCTTYRAANQSRHDITIKTISESHPLGRFTVRLSALVIAPEVFIKNNACSAVYTEYLTFLQKRSECNLSRGHCGESRKKQKACASKTKKERQKERAHITLCIVISVSVIHSHSHPRYNIISPLKL